MASVLKNSHKSCFSSMPSSTPPECCREARSFSACITGPKRIQQSRLQDGNGQGRAKQGQGGVKCLGASRRLCIGVDPVPMMFARSYHLQQQPSGPLSLFRFESTILLEEVHRDPLQGRRITKGEKGD